MEYFSISSDEKIVYLTFWAMISTSMTDSFPYFHLTGALAHGPMKEDRPLGRKMDGI